MTLILSKNTDFGFEKSRSREQTAILNAFAFRQNPEKALIRDKWLASVLKTSENGGHPTLESLNKMESSSKNFLLDFLGERKENIKVFCEELGKSFGEIFGPIYEELEQINSSEARQGMVSGSVAATIE